MTAAGTPAAVRVALPAHLRTLAKTGAEVTLEVAGEVTQGAVLDALEARFPMLGGTIRDRDTRGDEPSCASSPASRISRTSRPTRRCPKPWRAA